jgi:hypothetical protein
VAEEVLGPVMTEEPALSRLIGGQEDQLIEIAVSLAAVVG